MNGYINKEQVMSMIESLPVAEFNGVKMFSKKRVLKALDFTKPFYLTTKMRRNRNSEIFCQCCENIINLPAYEVEKLDRCPHCDLLILECKFDNY